MNHSDPNLRRITPYWLSVLLFVTLLLVFTQADAAESSQSVDTGNVAPLKTAFNGKFLIGAVLNFPDLQGRVTLDVALATRHFNALTAGNSLKPASVQPVEGHFR